MKSYANFYFLLSIFCCAVSCAKGKEPGECVVSGDPFAGVEDTNLQIVIFDEQVDVPSYLYQVKGIEILPYLKMAIIPNNENVHNTLLREPAVINIVSDLKFFLTKQEVALGQVFDEKKVSWGVDRVKAPILWKLGYRGQGVRVAVLDSGILPNFSDLGANIVEAKNFTGPDSQDWIDRVGHGTSVATMIAAIENNEFTRGVAPEASLFVAKILGENNLGADSFSVRAIDWAIGNNVRIVNMSFGQYQMNEVLHRAIERAMKQGVLIVAAAGNDGQPECYGSNVGYPAKHNLVLAVGATNANDTIADFSSHGPEVDVVAPGVNIGSISDVNPITYSIGDGTSYAAPHVAGVAALILSYAPYLTSYQLFSVLTLSAEDFGENGKDDYYGFGIVNAERAMMYAKTNHF